MDTLARWHFVAQLVDAKLMTPEDGLWVLNAPAEKFTSALFTLGLVVETQS